MASPAAEPRESSPLDLERFAATPLRREPFDFLIVPGFLKPGALPVIEQDFPEITKGGRSESVV